MYSNGNESQPGGTDNDISGGSASPSNRPLKILMTEGTSLSARQTLYGIGGRHTIDVLDPAALCQGRFSSFVRRWYRCPSYSRQPEEFLRFLVERLRREKYDVLLPTHEQVFLLSRFRDSFTPHVGLALPDFPAMRRMQDKADFVRLLRELDLPHPETEIVGTRGELDRDWDFPVYIKVGHSTAGCGVHLVEDRDELRELIARLESDGTLGGGQDILVQQPAKGGQATVQAVFQHGRMLAAHCFEARKLGVGGMSSARVSAEHPVVVEHIQRMGEHLQWHGAIFLDYFYDAQEGRPEYLEANPRIGETVNALLSGLNLPEILLRVSVGDSLDPGSFPASRSGVRTHSGYILLISAALKGAGRLDLLGELRAARRGRGLYEDSEDDLTRPAEDRLSALPYFWICLQLFTAPGMLSRSLVAKTIKNYSLPAAAVEGILKLPGDVVERMWGASK